MSPAVLRRSVDRLSHTHVDSKKRAKELRAEVKAFECKYRMTTKRMLSKVRSGELAERGDIEIWLTKYNLLQLHAGA